MAEAAAAVVGTSLSQVIRRLSVSSTSSSSSASSPSAALDDSHDKDEAVVGTASTSPRHSSPPEQTISFLPHPVPAASSSSSSSSSSSLPPSSSASSRFSLIASIDDDDDEHSGGTTQARVWTSLQHSTLITYPTSDLRSMKAQSMPEPGIFQTAERQTPAERETFWLKEGGEHLQRFNKSEEHKCHLLLVMWHDFQQLPPANQSSCKAGYIENTYNVLSKARNATRALRQLQAFAQYACIGQDVSIEPSKFIECDSEVLCHPTLFKELVQGVQRAVSESERQYKAAHDKLDKSKSGAPSSRVLKNAAKQPLPKLITSSAALCQRVCQQVLAEHPLIAKVVSAEVKDGLPYYFVQIKSTPEDNILSSAEETAYSYDALAVRSENLALLSAFNKRWKSEVSKVGEEIDPVTRVHSCTVTWKGAAQVSVVSKRFFEVVGWLDYYHLLRQASTDDTEEHKAAPATPARVGSELRDHIGVSPIGSLSASSASSTTPTTPAGRTAEKLIRLANCIASLAMSDKDLSDLVRVVAKYEKKSLAASTAETDKEVASENDMENDDGQEVDDNEEDEDAEHGPESDAEDEAEDEMRRGKDEEESKDEREDNREDGDADMDGSEMDGQEVQVESRRQPTRRSKRKASSARASDEKGRTQRASKHARVVQRI